MLVRRDHKEHLSQPNQRVDDRRINQRFSGYRGGDRRWPMNGLRKATPLLRWLRSPPNAGVLRSSVHFSDTSFVSRGSDTQTQPTRRHGDCYQRGVPARDELQLGVAPWSPCHRFAASNLPGLVTLSLE
jgi:hypothetical protein